MILSNIPIIEYAEERGPLLGLSGVQADTVVGSEP